MSRRLAISFGLIAYYFLVTWYSGFFANPSHYLFEIASDTQEYLSVANWIYHGQSSEMIAHRSFFYPLVLGFLNLFSAYGVWLGQAAMWLASALLFWDSIQRVTTKKPLRAIAAVFFGASWSPILLTLIALTESLAMLLFSVTVAALLRRRWTGALLSVGLLAVTKPNYAPTLLITILLAALAQWRGLGLPTRTQMARAIALAVLPVLLQVALNRAVTGTASNSNIGSYVLKICLYTQVFARANNYPVEKVRAMVLNEPITNQEMLGYLWSHKALTLSSLGKNIEENIRGVQYLDEDPHPGQNFWRKQLNSVFYWLHILLTLPLLVALAKTRAWEKPEHLELCLFAAIFWASFLPTAISFWAADRFAAPLIVVWPLAYIRLTQAWTRARE